MRISIAHIVEQDFFRIIDFLRDKYQFDIVDKSDSLFMKALSLFLDELKVMNKEVFLNSYSTTINDTIYIPFELGNAKSRPLHRQLHNLIHEITHVLQFRKEKYMPFLYLLDKNSRAIYEERAWGANIEFKYLLDNHYNPDFSYYADKILNYDCTTEHRDMVRSLLESDFEMFKQGIRVCEVADVAYDYIRRNKIGIEL